MTKEIQRRKAVEDIIPWYVNDSLSNKEIRRSETLISSEADLHDRLTVCQNINRLVNQQVDYLPSEDVEKRLFAQISTHTAFPMHHVHIYAILITIVTLVVSWLVVKPGIVLEWKVNRGDLDTFRIYRSVENENNFEIIHETSIEANSNKFQYIDTNLLPWHSYTYLVEGSGDIETIALSQTLSSEAIKVLPTWILIIILSICIGYLGTWLYELVKYAPIRPSPDFYNSLA